MTQVIDAYASQIHYFEHMLPIWEALPPSVRGVFHLVGTAKHATTRVERPVAALPFRDGGPILVAGYDDLRAVPQHPAVLLNHGAGQSYDGDPESAGHPAYSGGTDRDNVVLFLEPGSFASAKTLARDPDANIAEIGSPYLDLWHILDIPVPVEPGLVAISFHWENQLCPEAGNAFEEYKSAVIELTRDTDIRLLGHGHPRIYRRLAKFYDGLGIEHTGSFTEVLTRAAVYVIDNSSTGPEFASTGRPIVWMNPSTYRRDVTHGGRFWDWDDLGWTVNSPHELQPTVEAALHSPVPHARNREIILDTIYTERTGHAAQKAADAIMRVLEE